MATLFVFTWILSIQSILSAITSPNTNNNVIPLSPELFSRSSPNQALEPITIDPITIEQPQSEALVAYPNQPTPCIMPACVNPCGEFEPWFGPTPQSRPYCLGYPNTRCQGYAECNIGCYARYFNTITGAEIFNCIIVYPPPPTPQPTTAVPTTAPPTTATPTIPAPIIPAPITPQPTPNPVPVSNPNPNPYPNPNPNPQPNPYGQPAAPYCVAQGLPSPGHQCISTVPTADRCCQPGGPGSARCKYIGMNFRGDAIGFCCVRNNMDGCRYDSDCCSPDYVCSYGICLRPLGLAGTGPITPLSINVDPDPMTNPNPPINAYPNHNLNFNPSFNGNTRTDTNANTNTNGNTNPNPDPNPEPNPNLVSEPGPVLKPVEVPPVTLSDLAALGLGQQSPQTQNANPNAAVASDSLPLDIMRPPHITDKHDKNGYGKYMSVGLTTGTMIWVSFVLLWLSLCSILYWFRKRPESYIDDIMDDDTIIGSDTYDDNRLEIATPKLEPMPVPAEIDDL